jgi:hypothetical protein
MFRRFSRNRIPKGRSPFDEDDNPQVKDSKEEDTDGKTGDDSGDSPAVPDESGLPDVGEQPE